MYKTFNPDIFKQAVNFSLFSKLNKKNENLAALIENTYFIICDAKINIENNIDKFNSELDKQEIQNNNNIPNNTNSEPDQNDIERFNE
ncbi:MAG TPA: hypothetical protein PKY81_10405 [bacterium]|nr:hypothetical protein [bacterium]HPN31358.1 hypothetical protein [bacterium]